MEKFPYIAEFLLEFIIDSLCLTETWLLVSGSDDILAELPNSYSVDQVPRGSSWGGVAVIYHRGFSNIRSFLKIGWSPLN